MMQMIIRIVNTAVPRYGPICSMNQLLAMGTGLLLGADEGLGAFGHGRGGAADRIGHVIVADGRLEWARIDGARLAESFPGGGFDRVQTLKALVGLVELGTE